MLYIHYIYTYIKNDILKQNYKSMGGIKIFYSFLKAYFNALNFPLKKLIFFINTLKVLKKFSCIKINLYFNRMVRQGKL